MYLYTNQAHLIKTECSSKRRHPFICKSEVWILTGVGKWLEDFSLHTCLLLCTERILLLFPNRAQHSILTNSSRAERWVLAPCLPACTRGEESLESDDCPQPNDAAALKQKLSAVCSKLPVAATPNKPLPEQLLLLSLQPDPHSTAS